MAANDHARGRAFVVRPFLTQSGDKGIDVDFEKVHARLIGPALDALGLAGGTTTEFFHQGDIRIDMFHELIVADLVIADVSLHNANAFYELGIRHALRDRSTVLIRAKGVSDKRVFNLASDRTFDYNPDAPEQSVDDLVQVIGDTLARRAEDSPVFSMLSGHRPVDPATVVSVPPSFDEDIQRAGTNGDLQLLAHEVLGLSWELEGLRRVARLQFKRKDWLGAANSWNQVRRRVPDDIEANRKLATVYQNTDDLTESNLAIRRVTAQPKLVPEVRAEFLALQASNHKKQWLEAWQGHAAGEERRRRALESPHLDAMCDSYREGFRQDRNHYYSGINALACVRALLELARAFPELRAARFEGGNEERELQAKLELSRLSREADALATGVGLAIDTALLHDTTDEWARLTRADLAFLNDPPERVTQAYRTAQADVSGFPAQTMRRQIRMFRDLDLRLEQCEAAFGVIGDEQEHPPTEAPARIHAVLFTGHRVDAEGRSQPRFPRTETAKQRARELIAAELRKVVDAQGNHEPGKARRLIGIAGAASGGDLLFHELCGELDVESTVYLALPEKSYLKASVLDGGNEWVERYRALCERSRPRELGRDEAMPPWLSPRRDYSIWERSNLWMLYNALAISDAHVTLISLWNGEGGDGPGGTFDMVHQAKAHGALHLPIDAKLLLEGA